MFTRRFRRRWGIYQRKYSYVYTMTTCSSTNTNGQQQGVVTSSSSSTSSLWWWWWWWKTKNIIHFWLWDFFLIKAWVLCRTVLTGLWFYIIERWWYCSSGCIVVALYFILVGQAISIWCKNLPSVSNINRSCLPTSINYQYNVIDIILYRTRDILFVCVPNLTPFTSSINSTLFVYNMDYIYNCIQTKSNQHKY